MGMEPATAGAGGGTGGAGGRGVAAAGPGPGGSLRALGGAPAPPPAVTAKVTVWLLTAPPLRSTTVATRGLGSGLPTMPVWLLPDVARIADAGRPKKPPL